MLKIRGGLSRFHGVIDLSDLNLPENATKFQIREASRKRTIEPLGLPYDATDQQIINALKDREDEITAAKTRQ